LRWHNNVGCSIRIIKAKGVEARVEGRTEVGMRLEITWTVNVDTQVGAC